MVRFRLSSLFILTIIVAVGLGGITFLSRQSTHQTLVDRAFESAINLGATSSQSEVSFEGLSLSDEWVTQFLPYIDSDRLSFRMARVPDCTLEHVSSTTYHVVFDDSDITNDGFKNTASSRVRILSLRRVKITDIAAGELGKWGHLEDINLSGVPIGDHGVALLAQSGSIRKITLCDTLVSDQSLDDLGNMPSLVEVNLDGTQVSAEGVKKLQEKMPLLEITVSEKIRRILETASKPL